MSNYDKEDNELNSLLPFGANIRPLLTASGLSEYDLKFLLQKRGIFIKQTNRNTTVPEIASLLLSPREFEILKNRQSKKESNIKRSTAQDEWIGGAKNLVDVIDANIEELIKELVGENSSYSIHSLNMINHGLNQIVIEGEIRRNDWTKDIFSITTTHPWKLIIEKIDGENIIEYAVETTAPETKELVNKVQKLVHKTFQAKNVINKGRDIQKIIATHFIKNEYLFEYLFSFAEKAYPSLVFKRIVDIEIGLDDKRRFPETFKWLKGNIGELKLTALQDKKLEETDIIELGKLGVLVFGEIEAEFGFDYVEAKGVCVIQFGFPKFYAKRKHIEFETKISKINLGKNSSHVSKVKVKRFLLKEFQREKHKTFEKFKKDNKVNVEPKDTDRQFLINFIEY